MQFTFKHTNFNVLDLQRSMDFYKEALGLTEVSRIENPDFTAFQEIVSTEVSPAVDAFVDGNHFVNRHTANGNHSVYVRISGDDFIGTE